MSEASKSPAQVINDLTDQVRLLRQDVVNLTATATTKKEAAALRASVQASVKEAQDRSAKVTDAAERVINASYHANLQAARDGADKAVAGLRDEVRDVANTMRLETLKGGRQALLYSGGVLVAFGGIIALGVIVGALGHFWLQGRADARAFGEHPGRFCEAAGGKVQINPDGSSYCAFWIDPPEKVQR